MKKYFKKLPEKLLEYIDILRLTELLIKECNNWGQSEICDTNIKISSDVSNRISQFPSHVKSQIILNNIKQKVNYCQRCQLWKSRLNPVFGTGIINADIMFVGEAPGYDEDHRGEPFVGKSGQLLTKIIEAMNYKRETVYISNIVKCHPMIDPHNPEKRSNDRPPTNVEMKACLPYLDMQIAVINPKIIVSLGGSSIKALTNDESPINKIRKKNKEYNGIKLIPTFHPAAVLRNNILKKLVWEDMKKVMHYLKIGRL